MNATPEPGQTWELAFDGSVEHYLVLEAVDVSLHRFCGRQPEPGFWIASLETGQTTYVVCDAFTLDADIWKRIT